MCTKMTENDYELALEVFGLVCQPLARKLKMTAYSLRHCIISPFTTSHGGLCLSGLVTGTAYGSVLTV